MPKKPEAKKEEKPKTAYRLRSGIHSQNRKTYTPGDIVLSSTNLVEKFGVEKFELIGTPVPAAPVETVVVEEPETEEPETEVVITPEAEEDTETVAVISEDEDGTVEVVEYEAE